MRIARTTRTPLAFLMLVALLLAACGGSNPNTVPSGGSDSQNARTAATQAAPAATNPVAATAVQTEARAVTQGPAAGSAADAFLRTQKAYLNAKTFRATMVSVDLTSSQVFTTTLEYQAPDRYHIVNGTTETIVISPTTYMKVGASNWAINPIDMSAILNTVRNPSVAENYADYIANVQLAGSDTVDGKNSLVYTYSSNNTVEGLTSEAKTWVDAQTDLPLKTEMESEYQGTRTHVTILYDYDPTIQIEAPQVK